MMLIVEHVGGVGWGGVFKSVVVGSKMLTLVNVHVHALLRPDWFCYGPGMPCTSTSLGKRPEDDKERRVLHDK